MSADQGSLHVLTVRVQITDESGKSWGTTEDHLVVTNIPKAWSLRRVNPQDGEKEGVGLSRQQAVMAWLGNNHGPRMIAVDQVPLILLQSMLERDRRLGEDIGRRLLTAWQVAYPESL